MKEGYPIVLIESAHKQEYYAVLQHYKLLIVEIIKRLHNTRTSIGKVNNGNTKSDRNKVKGHPYFIDNEQSLPN